MSPTLPHPARIWRRAIPRNALAIVRYNWPLYVVGVVAAAAGLVVAAHGTSSLLRVGATIAVVGVTWLVAVSLLASIWVYDVSPLYRWSWIPAALPEPPRRWLQIHSGLDDASAALHRLFPGAAGEVVDLYAPNRTPSASIRRARRAQGTVGTPSASTTTDGTLPARTASVDTTFLLFAAHELRRPEDRTALFLEAARVTRLGGSILLVEHVRDLANALAFGPGALHFYSAATWRRHVADAGLEIDQTFRLTPFVRIWRLRHPGIGVVP